MDSEYITKKHISEAALWRDKAPILTHLDLELTERCNNDCIHCNISRPERDGEAHERELKSGEWRGILEEAAELGVLSVQLTGGEPLLREDFEELYLLARRLGLRVQLFTNGRLITPRLADLLARIPPLEAIEITVYGMGPKSYEAVSRRPGSFDEFRRGLGLLLERKIPLILKWVLLPPNRSELDEFEAWAKKLNRGEEPPPVVLLFDLRGRRDSEDANRRIRALRLDPKEVIAVWNWGERFIARRWITSVGNFCSRPANCCLPAGPG